MRISDKERQRAVAELREASTGAYRHVDALDVIAGSVGVEVDGKFGHEVENETYAALADFIDRPAIKPEPSGRAYWRCPRCGAFNYRSAVTDCCGVIPAHYCANCGAEVNDEVD